MGPCSFIGPLPYVRRAGQFYNVAVLSCDLIGLNSARDCRVCLTSCIRVVPTGVSGTNDMSDGIMQIRDDIAGGEIQARARELQNISKAKSKHEDLCFWGLLFFI